MRPSSNWPRTVGSRAASRATTEANAMPAELMGPSATGDTGLGLVLPTTEDGPARVCLMSELGS